MAILSLSTPARAADKLQVDLTSPGLRARNHAPIPVEARFNWTGKSLLVGRLQLELHEGNRVLESYRSDEFDLTTGEQSFHLLLPPPPLPDSDSQVEVQMKFLTAAGEIGLDPQSLFLPTVSERALVLGWCSSHTASSNEVSELEQSLMFDRFVSGASDLPRRLLFTSVIRLMPEDLPAQPLACASYDVIVLTAEGFAEAHEGQLQALARWVKGGGSVCVFATGQLEARHLSFLNQLANSDDSHADSSDRSSGNPQSQRLFFTDSSGNLLPIEQKILCLHSGLGRSVIVTGNFLTDLHPNSLEWRRAAAFLWKVRELQIQAMILSAYSVATTNESTREHVDDSTDSTNTPRATIEQYRSAAQLSQSRRTGPIMSMTLTSIDQVLTLTDEQKPKVKAALDEFNTARQQVRNVDPSQRASEMQAARQSFDAKMKEILTTNQFAKYQSSRRVSRTGIQGPVLVRTSGTNRVIVRNPALVQSVNGIYNINTPFGVQASQLANELVTPLLPKRVRLIPFPAVIGMLCLFLLVIGPGDYFGLGWLRRRRYTWVLFPAVSFAFMLAMVLMAGHFLGMRDQRRSLIVVDVDKDGAALRWNRFDLVFAAADRQAVTELKDALWVPLPSGGTPYVVGNPRYGYARGYSDPDSENGPASYDGVVPIHFHAAESIHQWQPRLNRMFSFEPPPVPLIPNWREVEQAWPDLKLVRAKLSAKEAFTGDLCMISSSGSVTFDFGPKDVQPNTVPAITQPTDLNVNNANGPYAPQNGLAPPYQNYTLNSDSGAILPSSILEQLCFGPANGLLSVVSQISPNGGATFEDLPAMDKDAGDSALVILAQSGDDIIIYRRFFHGN